MTLSKTQWIVIGGLVVGGWLWYRSRQGQAALPATLAGQGTRNSPLPNPASGGQLSGSTGGPPVTESGQETQRIQARNLYSGPDSRHNCLLPNRWIDTWTAPQYGHCVTQAQFDAWVAVDRGPYPHEQDIQNSGILRQ